MSLTTNLLILHLFGVFLLVGGHTVATATAVAATRTNRTRIIAVLADVGNRAEMVLINPGTLITVLFGLWLVEEAGFSYTSPWLIASYALIGLALIVGALWLGPHGKQVREKAHELVDQGIDESDELQALAAEPRAALGGILETAIILVFIYLMVAKPGA